MFSSGETRGQTCSHAWDFNNPSEYSYDSGVVEVSGGTAHLRTLPLHDGWWTRTFDSDPGEDVAMGVSCAHDGSSVSVGHRDTGSGWDILVRKYGDGGDARWTRIVHNPAGDSSAEGVSCDPDGNPVVAGYTRVCLNDSIWVRKYDPDGGMLWTDIPITGRANDVSCDKENNSVVVGGVSGGAWVRKYDPDGGILWTKTAEEGGDFFSVSCDPDGNPVVAGYMLDGTEEKSWVRKYRGSNGDVLWTRTYDGGPGYDAATAVSCDPDGNPVVTGFVVDGTETDMRITRYCGSDGEVIWTRTCDEGEKDQPTGVSCDRNGDPVVSAFVQDGSDAVILVRKYSGLDGETVWTETCDNGIGNNYAAPHKNLWVVSGIGSSPIT